jgi:porphobilinogen synthase
MSYPASRLRRLRRTEGLRRLVRETRLDPADLILPLFVVGGHGVRRPVPSLPGVEHLSVDAAVEDARRAAALGVGGVMLFGVPEAEEKDATASAGRSDDGLVPTALRALRDAVPDLVLTTDLCLCGYTDHGHCGVVGPTG